MQKLTITALLAITSLTGTAQDKDTLKVVNQPNDKLLKKYEIPVKMLPTLNFASYYFAPPAYLKPSKGYPSTSIMLQKVGSTDNALSSINNTLAKDREAEARNQTLGAIALTAIFSGVAYQAINGEKFSKEAQKRREQNTTPQKK